MKVKILPFRRLTVNPKEILWFPFLIENRQRFIASKQTNTIKKFEHNTTKNYFELIKYFISNINATDRLIDFSFDPTYNEIFLQPQLPNWNILHMKQIVLN